MNLQNKFANSTWETPIWTGTFSFGSISSLLSEETKYLKSLKDLFIDQTYGSTKYQQTTNGYLIKEPFRTQSINFEGMNDFGFENYI